MKLADFVITYLAEAGIDKMFVVSGAANAYLIDAFTRTDKTQYVATMHEQAAGFAAEGYAKIKGLPGVAIATSGPGGMNLVTPIGNCYYDSVPAIFITGQINSEFLRSDPSIRQVGFQETDIVAIVSPITKYAKLIARPEDIKYELEKAMFFATNGRPGPVLLDIPQNFQKVEVDPEKMVGFDAEAVRGAYDIAMVDKKIDELLSDLQQSKRPVMLIGGGVGIAHAQALLQRVGRMLKIPVFPTWNALDVVPSDYEYYGGRVGTYGGRGRNFGLQNSDLLLAVGSRISGRITGGNLKTFARAAKKYVVDVDPALVQKKLQQVPFDVSILCDARIFLERLEKKLTGIALPDVSSWTNRVLEWKDKYDPVRPEFFASHEHVNPYAFMRILSQEMQARDILVADCGGNIVTGNHAFETKNGQRYITNNGNSPMGFSFCGAMGAWFASDKKQNVVCIIGDGGFTMNIQEVQTLRTYGIKVKTFIMNNHMYGIIRAFQETNVEGRYEASGPKGYVTPDFVKIVDAYGISARRLTGNDEARKMIQEALAYDGPLICDVDCGDWYAYEPRVFGWATPIEDMYPYLPRDEFRTNMIIEPVEGWENPPLPGGDAKIEKTETHE
ncbi:MAG: thiamine pyrophosphate-binding protein [Candidatus Sungbacteria bacterium]|nr:thiamine pyrophosphate-binding protein [Candidatus Sungbacteria bacterium]